MTKKNLCSVSFVFCIVASSLALRAQTVVDDTLQVARYAQGFSNPTGIVFLDSSGTALVAEKDTGKIKLLQNRAVTATVLDLDVANQDEQGLLGIALSPTFSTDHFVYTYHTAARADGGAAITNKISRYVYDPTAKTMTLTRKIIDLPATATNHNGGKLIFGPDNRLWTVIGDEGRPERTLNVDASTDLNNLGAILHLQADGRRVTNNPFASSSLNARDARQNIYAYGVRNSFGLAFDPVTNDLWDTENGPSRMDEINRVLPGMNSGWQRVMGPAARDVNFDPADLVSLGAKATYQDPKMAWDKPIAPTDVEFLRNNNLGAAYRNDMFVGDVNTGSLYHFDLTSNRKSLQLTGALADRVADNTGSILAEQESIIFGSGFGVTSDIVSGPGGMYVLSLSKGALYRISEKVVTPGMAPMSIGNPVPEPASVGAAVVLLAIGSRRASRVRRIGR